MFKFKQPFLAIYGVFTKDSKNASRIVETLFEAVKLKGNAVRLENIISVIRGNYTIDQLTEVVKYLTEG